MRTLLFDWFCSNVVVFCLFVCFFLPLLPHHKDDVKRDDSQQRFLAQHIVAMLKQCCNHSKQYQNNVVTMYCAKNRRCELSRETSAQVSVTTPSQLEFSRCLFAQDCQEMYQKVSCTYWVVVFHSRVVVITVVSYKVPNLDTVRRVFTFFPLKPFLSQNILIIHKEKQKKLMFNECLYISDKDTAKT